MPERAGIEARSRAEARRERRASVTDPDVVMAAAARLLASRPWSVTDMRRRLAVLGYPSGLVETVIGRLLELGYLDDQRYAAAWVAARDRARPRGSAALRRELTRKGIDPGVITGVLADREMAEHPDGEWPQGAGSGSADLDAALRLLLRRGAALAREPDPRKRRQKAYALLARNGFDPETCAQAVSRASSGHADGAP
jgi:regulatory protein